MCLPVEFDEFKQQLYEKSVSRSLVCFEYYLTEQYFHDANMCLQTWKVHSQEIGLFDEERYKALKERLKDARAKKAEEDKKKAEEDKKKAESENTEQYNSHQPNIDLFKIRPFFRSVIPGLTRNPVSLQFIQ